MDAALVHIGVLEALLDGVHALAEEVHVELLELGAGDGGEEVDALVEGVDLNRGLGAGGQGPLGALAGSAEATHGAGVAGDVPVVHPLELGHEVGDEAVVEVLAALMGVTGGGLHLEDALLDGQERHIAGAAAEVEDEHVALAGAAVLLVEAVGDGGSGRLVDDAEHVEAGNGTSVLGGLALGVVEGRGDGDDGSLDGLVVTEVGLGNVPHLHEHHGGDLLGGKALLLTLVLNCTGQTGTDVWSQPTSAETFTKASRSASPTMLPDSLILQQTGTSSADAAETAARGRREKGRDWKGHLTLNHGLLAGAGDNGKRPVLDIALDSGVAELAADEALGVEDGVDGVHGDLVLGGVTNEALAVCEANVGRRGAVALVVGNDLHAVILPHTDAAAGAMQEGNFRSSVSKPVVSCDYRLGTKCCVNS